MPGHVKLGKAGEIDLFKVWKKIDFYLEKYVICLHAVTTYMIDEINGLKSLSFQCFREYFSLEGYSFKTYI